MVPQFMLQVSKRSEISCHLANNRENFMRQVFCTATPIMAKVGSVNYFMSRQSQRIHRDMIVVILASYVFLATSISCASAAFLHSYSYIGN